MSETIYMGPDEIRASAGKFRTTRRYIRAGSNVSFYVPKGQTMVMDLGGPGGTPRFRYSVGGYIVDVYGALSFTADATGARV